MSAINRTRGIDDETYNTYIKKFTSKGLMVPSINANHEYEKGLTSLQRIELRIRLVLVNTAARPEPVTRKIVINALEANDWVPFEASSSILGWK